MSNPVYDTCPLGPRQIRILVVCPSLQQNLNIQGQLAPADLDNVPPFNALSYTWGDGPEDETISLEGHEILIKRSLGIALRALRNPHKPVRLWIDQICIDQKNDAEKSLQIPLMRDIYSKSAATIGWLGPATRHSDTAMQYMRDISTQVAPLGLATLNDVQLTLLIAAEADLEHHMVVASDSDMHMRKAVYQIIDHMPLLLDHSATEGMIELCHLEYFKRGWIQQEIAIPKTLVFHWGTQAIDATLFFSAVYFHLVYVQMNLSRLAKPEARKGIDASLFERVQRAQIWAYIQPSLIIRHRYHDPSLQHKTSTARIIERLRRVKFRYPSDRIYGILGVVNDAAELGLTEVNVKEDWKILFRRATRRIINGPVQDRQSSEGLNFLSLVDLSNARWKDLPSWVPDLTNLGNTLNLASHTTTLGVSYDASLGTQHLGEHDVFNEGQLRVRGIVIDKIQELGAAWPEGPFGQRDHEDGFDSLHHIEEFANRSVQLISSNPSSKHPYRRDPSRLAEAAWRVPILNRESISSTGSSRLATAWSREGHEAVKYTMKFQSLVPDLKRIISEIPVTQQEEQELHHLDPRARLPAEVQLKLDKRKRLQESPEHAAYQAHLDALHYRKPFLGIAGFTGLGPLSMELNDIICILYGASFPFVLRPEPDGGSNLYTVVGECYCDGIMAGEMMASNDQPTDFVLV